MIDRALQLAAQARLLAPPNPAVGCVLVSADGRVIGQGHTQRTGQAHAEIMALRDAAERGQDVRGATAYVTLEPCSHHGRTGPCCEALIQAGIAKVVGSVQDPNPQVSGRGFARLRAAGVEVEVGPGAQEARALNLGFFSRMTRGRPWVRLKAAASLDGLTALADGRSQWITSAAARADGHAWRARACAVVTGIGTVLKDDPLLDVRECPTPRQPGLVVVDSRLRTPPGARLFSPQRPVRIYCAEDDTQRRRALEAGGAEVVCLPDAQGRVDLAGMLDDLARRETNELHVEAGQTLHGALLSQGLVDELLVYLAPRLLGQGLPMAALAPPASLDHALGFDLHSHSAVGPDLRLVLRRAPTSA